MLTILRRSSEHEKGDTEVEGRKMRVRTKRRMNAHHDRSTIRRPGTFRSHLSPVTGLLMAILALGLTHPPQGSAQTLRPLPAPPVAQRGVDGTIQVLTDRGGLHVDVREARPADVLQTLGARAGVAVTVEGDLPGRLTRVFTVASVEAAVREVVRGYPTVLVFEPDRAIRVIALGTAPGEGAPAAPSPTVVAAPSEAGQAHAATDETAPGADPDPVRAEDEAPHHRGRARGDSTPAVRRPTPGDPDPAARQAGTLAPGPRDAGRAHAAPDTAGAGRPQAFRAELMETLMRAMRPSAIAPGRPRPDGRTQ